MSDLVNKFYRINSYYDLGHKCFLLGTFFLPTAFPISIILYLLSSIISFCLNGFNITRSNLNYPLLISLGIIIFSTLNITFLNRPEILDNYNISFIWLNLTNWLPTLIF